MYEKSHTPPGYLTFTFACISLWAMLTAVANLSPHWPQTPPAFTRLCLSLSPFLLALPLPVLAYCVFALIRKHGTSRGWDSFHRLDDGRTVSGFFSGPLCGLSSLFSVVGDQVR